MDVRKLKHTVRPRTVNQMGEIYAAAKQVLVLDSELQRASADSEDEISSAELLARLVCCSWMRRYWTLQEGALATRIAFLSASGLVTPLVPGEGTGFHINQWTFDALSSDILPGPYAYWWVAKFTGALFKDLLASLKGERTSRKAPVLPYLQRRFQTTLDDITCTLPRNLAGQDELGMFCNSLAYRNTTMKEDLPVIFANLLDISAFGILQTESSKRVQVLLQSLGRLPAEFLFNTGPRAETSMDSLYRWAPSAPSKTTIIQSQVHALTWSEAGDLEFSYNGQNEELAAVVLDGDTPR